MMTRYRMALVSLTLIWILLLFGSCEEEPATSVTVPIVLDHNRMLVDAEIQGADGSWREARLWIDTGNPYFFLSDDLARDLGYDLPDSSRHMNVPPPAGVRIGGMDLDFEGVQSHVRLRPDWLLNAMHNDANLPSTVLRRYHIVFDYPNRSLTIALPGTIEPRGRRASARIDPRTGIPQIDAVIDGDSMSFALDCGASYSFVAQDVIDSLALRHPDWPLTTGTTGCANMWGWWPPNESTLQVMRVPEIMWDTVSLTDVAMVGVREVSERGTSLRTFYSSKTASPVVGFLGPNAFNLFRVEIDFANSAIYFEKGDAHDPHDLDLVGLTLRPELDGRFTVIGAAVKDGEPVVEGVEEGDVLLRVGDLETTGATMGTVVDALRGKPGEVRVLELERDGEQFTVEVKVKRVL